MGLYLHPTVPGIQIERDSALDWVKWHRTPALIVGAVLCVAIAYAYGSVIAYGIWGVLLPAVLVTAIRSEFRPVPGTGHRRRRCCAAGKRRTAGRVPGSVAGSVQPGCSDRRRATARPLDVPILPLAHARPGSDGRCLSCAALCRRGLTLAQIVAGTSTP